MEQQIYSVTQINTYIQSMMDSDRLLSGLCIRGEISNYKVYPSGHHYFSLKDATGALRCVMFKSSAIRLRFRPENGMKVLALGKISVFPQGRSLPALLHQSDPGRGGRPARGL